MKSEPAPQSLPNMVKWLFAILILVGALVADHYYAHQPFAYRLIGGLALFAVASTLALRTNQGLQLIAFAKQANIELRKVVWPTRAEIIQMTTIVVLVVIALGIILWGLDTVLLWVIGMLTGQRG